MIHLLSLILCKQALIRNQKWKNQLSLLNPRISLRTCKVQMQLRILLVNSVQPLSQKTTMMKSLKTSMLTGLASMRLLKRKKLLMKRVQLT